MAEVPPEPTQYQDLDATHQTTFIQEGSCTDRDESGICETGQQDVGIDLDKWEGFYTAI